MELDHADDGQTVLLKRTTGFNVIRCLAVNLTSGLLTLWSAGIERTMCQSSQGSSVSISDFSEVTNPDDMVFFCIASVLAYLIVRKVR